MWLKFLHFLGLTNLSDEQVELYEKTIKETKKYHPSDYLNNIRIILLLIIISIALFYVFTGVIGGYVVIAFILGIIAIISTFILLVQIKKSRERVSRDIQIRLIQVSVIQLILIILVFIPYLFRNFKIQGKEKTVDEKAIVYLVNSLVKAEAKRDSVQKEVHKINQERESLRAELSQLKSEKEELENQLHGFQDNTKINSLKLEISKREKKNRSLEKEVSDMTNKLKKTEEWLTLAEKTIKEKEVELRKLKDYLELINTLAIFELDSVSTNKTKNFHKSIVWSADKKYVAVMYYYQDVGNISIIDLSERKEIKSIQIKNIYNRIRFSIDNSKIIADNDIFVIKDSPELIKLKPIFRTQPVT